jgi:hypothetical protein
VLIFAGLWWTNNSGAIEAHTYIYIYIRTYIHNTHTERRHAKNQFLVFRSTEDVEFSKGISFRITEHFIKIPMVISRAFEG